MKLIDINGFIVGGSQTFVIADIGSNHMQSLTLAKESIDAVVEAGANAVKFQSIQLNELYLNPSHKVSNFIKQLEFPENWHQILKEYCDKKNIIFFSSPTYLKAVDLLEEVKVDLYKLASAQIGSFPQIVEKVAALNKPTLFSTGIANYEDVIKSVQIFNKYKNDNFIILHCNSIYPTPPDKVNLQMIEVYKKMFNNPVGFSDHTIGTHIASAAVIMGASVIEKHFTLDRSFTSPDSNEFACDPIELKKLVKEIRDIENAKNTFVSRMEILDEENKFKKTLTYRIVANNILEAGKIIHVNDINYLRSEEGLSCNESESIIGKKTKHIIYKHELITHQNVI